jgi:cell division septation protein DedD
MKLIPLALIGLTIALVGCGSKFENTYTEACAKEGKYTKERCKCVAGLLDKTLNNEQKQMMLNPGDISIANYSKAMELVKPALAALETCRQATSESRTQPKPMAKPAQTTAPVSESVVTGAELRLVVQVGAFADADKARDVRLKIEKAGLKAYTQVAETKEGKKIRVRVGPFSSRAEADKAASKIKTLDLPATILSL